MNLQTNEWRFAYRLGVRIVGSRKSIGRISTDTSGDRDPLYVAADRVLLVRGESF